MRVLVLEPNQKFASYVKEALEEKSFTVACSANAEDAINKADEFSPDLVVCELGLSGHSGTEFIYEFRTYSDWAEVPVVVYSWLRPSEDIIKSKDWRNLGVAEVLYKPDVTLKELAVTVESLL